MQARNETKLDILMHLENAFGGLSHVFDVLATYFRGLARDCSNRAEDEIMNAKTPGQ